MNAAFAISLVVGLSATVVPCRAGDPLLASELDSDVVALVEYRGRANAGHSPTVGSISVYNYLMGMQLQVVSVQRGDLFTDTLVVEQPRGPKFADVLCGDEAGVFQPGEYGLTRPPWERSRHILDIGDRFVAYLANIPPEERSRAGFRIIDWIPVTGHEPTSTLASSLTTDGLRIGPTWLCESLPLCALASKTDN